MSPVRENSRDESLDANDGIAPADRKKKRRRRKVSFVSASQRRRRIQKGKKIQINKNRAGNFLGSKLDVHCGKVAGVLFVQKMKKGSSEKCIEASDGTLFTLREFEVKGGRESWKSWKRSISYNGSTLEKLIQEGKLPNPKRIWGKKKKTPSGLDHQSSQFQSSDTMTATVVPQESSAKQGRYQFRHAKKISSPDSASTLVVTCRDSLEQATSLTASESPSEAAEIVCQLLSGSTDTMTATEEPQEPGRAPEKTASQSVGNLSSVPVPASCTPAATNTSSLRTNIMNSLHRMMNGCRTLERKLQDVEGHMGRLEEEQKHLEQALNISNLQKRMNDIIHQQAELKTSLRRIVATLGLEEPQL